MASGTGEWSSEMLILSSGLPCPCSIRPPPIIFNLTIKLKCLQIRQKDAQIATLLRAAHLGGGGAAGVEDRTPLVLAGSKIVAGFTAGPGTSGAEVLSPTDRAALLAAEKAVGGVGGGVIGSAAGPAAGTAAWLAPSGSGSTYGGGGGVRYRARMRERKWGEGGVRPDRDAEGGRGKKAEARGTGDGESDAPDSDEDWSSDDSGGSGWDGAVEAAFLADMARSKGATRTGAKGAAEGGGDRAVDENAVNVSTAPLHLHSLPPRDAPLGLLARLSLETSPITIMSTASCTDKDQTSGRSKVVDRARSARKRLRGDAGDGEDADMEADGEDYADDADVDMIVTLSASANANVEGVDGADDAWGIANKAYFQPGACSQLQCVVYMRSLRVMCVGPTSNLALRRVLNTREFPPPIIASGLVSWAEASELFNM